MVDGYAVDQSARNCYQVCHWVRIPTLQILQYEKPGTLVICSKDVRDAVESLYKQTDVDRGLISPTWESCWRSNRYQSPAAKWFESTAIKCERASIASLKKDCWFVCYDQYEAVN